MVEPLDYEEYVQQVTDVIERDNLHELIVFPPDDIEVGVVSRKTRTTGPIVPDEKE